jgi:hypothetical protein
MISHLRARAIGGGARWGFREHCRVPSIPLADEPVVDVLAAFLQVGAFQWIVDGRGGAAGGRGEGIQAGRGDLRKIPDRVGLIAGAEMDCKASAGYSLFPRKRESRIGGIPSAGNPR